MIRIATTIVSTLFLAALPATAADFLGVELCKGSTDTAVDLPIGSSLVLESVEIGDNGGLVMLLSARSGKVMNHVDDLMTGLTGNRGKGDGDGLEWTGGSLSGVAQRVAKKYAALAVASTDECTGSETVPAPAPAGAPRPTDVESVMQTPDPVPAAAAAVVAASQSPGSETVPVTESGAVSETESVPEPAAAPVAESESAAETEVVAGAAAVAVAETEPVPEPAAVAESDFNLVGALSHEAADQPWVDVMGVVANHTETGYKLATFDLSFFAADGSLICVDTISVSVLKTGQERAFRDAIRCPGYSHDEVAETRLQFAGGL